ncbi:MAG: thioredoxin [Nitrososphaerales archaeon]
MTREVRALTTETFEQDVVQSQRPVLVDFYADWCGPCKLVRPIVQELRSDYEGRVDVRKVDVDSNRDLANRYGVRCLPTLILFKDGIVQDTIVGSVPKSHLAEVIDRHADQATPA